MGTNITGIGNANAIGFKSRVTGGIYFPPELKDALVGVWSAYGKSNDSTDRNIIKNKIKDRGGDFVISNAAFKLNSGFGGFVEDFTSWDRIDSSTAEISNDGSKIKCINTTLNVQYLFNYINRDISSFKVKISNFTKGDITYYYRKEDGIEAFFKITPLSVVNSDKVIELPKSYNTVENGTGSRGGFYSSNINIGVTIEQIPSFEGAFVTDGVNDLITSTKTVQEMLGGSNEITVVSMIHQIGLISSQSYARNNYFIQGNDFLTNTISAIGKIGIYGYKGNLSNIAIVNDILGDKKDYSVDKANPANIDSVFSVNGTHSSAQLSSVAWYWTIIANKVLTSDQINQVIAYFNLDRTLNPDILCNITKQGITNDNHADFNDKLIDYSGNGRDIQMNNLAWKGGSGIAAKPFETIKDYAILSDEARQELTIYNEFSYKVKSNTPNCYWVVQSIIKDNTSYQVTIITDKDCYWIDSTSFTNNKGNKESIRKEYPIKANTPTQVIICGLNEFEYPEGIEPTTAVSYVNLKYAGEITVTFIPSHKGGLLLNGVNNFGKVTGMPVYKDYTVIADYIRTFAKENVQDAPILSKSKEGGDGAFIFNYVDYSTSKTLAYSFANINNVSYINDFERNIYYQSKYTNNGNSINAGTGVDTNSMWLGTYRDNVQNYFTGAIYSLMIFPYSMSEFLIERQLKKYKLGTLYPDMVEFRPVIKSSVELVNKPTFAIRGTSTLLNVGDYIPENSEIWLVITMNNAADRITKFVINGNTIDIPSSAYNPSTMKYGFPFTIDSKSPQKITMTIEQDENYVKFEPVITSNVEYSKLDFYLNNYQKRINIGDYIPKDVYLRANFYLKNNVDELTVFTFNGVNIGYKRSSVDDTAFNISQIYNYDSPQEVNITIDEYIRYEDIVQPYPVVFQIKDRNTNQIYSWGDKIKVGSSIQLTQGENPNLLSGLYSVQSYEYEGETYTYNQLKALIIIITKSGIQLSCNKVWTFDDNEPKCILSPRLLRIPNSSYKILGYIPDISGHGNNGKINNSAYAGASGANGYPYDYNNSSFLADSNLAKVVSGELVEYFAVKNSTGFSNITSGVYKGKIKVTGVTKAISENKISRLRMYTNSTTDNELIDITQDGNYNIDIKGVDNANRVYFYAIPINPNDAAVVRLTEPIYIEQIGEYEGAYCLDGVDDFVTIPTTVGGKQVLMKVNWDTPNASILYDQRGYNNEFAIYNGTNDSDGNPIPAYQGRNNGQTYIDGILNSNIKASELRAITHNITITNELSLGANKTYPIIGSSKSNGYYTNMALYDLMLFDEISTDDKIEELNKYIGVEAKVELPPYY